MISPRGKIFAIRRDDLTYNLVIVIIQAALKDVKKRWKIRNEFTIVCEYRNIERKKKKGTFRRHRSSIYSSLVETRERCEKGGGRREYKEVTDLSSVHRSGCNFDHLKINTFAVMTGCAIRARRRKVVVSLIIWRRIA